VRGLRCEADENSKERERERAISPELLGSPAAAAKILKILIVAAKRAKDKIN
jgi:hypothetical protein